MKTEVDELEKWGLILDEFFNHFSDSDRKYYHVDEFKSDGDSLAKIEELPTAMKKCRGYDLSFEEFWEIIEKKSPDEVVCKSIGLLSYQVKFGQSWSSITFYNVNNRGICKCEIAYLDPFISYEFRTDNEPGFDLTDIAKMYLFEDDLPWISVFSLDVNKKRVDIEAILNEVRKVEEIQWSNIKTELEYADEEKLKKRLNSEELEIVKNGDSNSNRSSIENKEILFEIYLKCLEV